MVDQYGHSITEPLKSLYATTTVDYLSGSLLCKNGRENLD
jgi:hypothetical protein